MKRFSLGALFVALLGTISVAAVTAWLRAVAQCVLHAVLYPHTHTHKLSFLMMHSKKLVQLFGVFSVRARETWLCFKRPVPVRNFVRSNSFFELLMSLCLDVSVGRSKGHPRHA